MFVITDVKETERGTTRVIGVLTCKDGSLNTDFDLDSRSVTGMFPHLAFTPDEEREEDK